MKNLHDHSPKDERYSIVTISNIDKKDATRRKNDTYREDHFSGFYSARGLELPIPQGIHHERSVSPISQKPDRDTSPTDLADF